jgi:hypothetical protein
MRVDQYSLRTFDVAKQQFHSCSLVFIVLAWFR